MDTRNNTSTQPNFNTASNGNSLQHERTRKRKLFIFFSILQFSIPILVYVERYSWTPNNNEIPYNEIILFFVISKIIIITSSPIVFGTKISSIGPKTMFNLSVLTMAACLMILCFLNLLNDRTTIILNIVFIIQIILDVATTAFLVALYTMIVIEFQGSVGTIFGATESFYGIGIFLVPILIGVLNGIGVFILSFLFVGSVLGSYYLIPDSNSQLSSPLTGVSCLEMFKMLRSPAIGIIAYSIFVTSFSLGFRYSTVSQHLDSIDPNLTLFHLGSVYVMYESVYIITAAIWGIFIDKTKQNKIKYFTLSGCICSILGFIVMGPLLPWNIALWTTCIGMVIFGLGLGATLVSGFVQLIQDAVLNGYPNDVSTYGLISGLYVFLTSLGNSIGKLTGVYIKVWVDFGFRWGTVLTLGLHFILLLMLLLYFYHLAGKNKRDTLSSRKKNEIPTSSTFETNQTSV